MDDPFAGEPGLLDVTVTARVVGERVDSVILRAIVENGTGAEGGEIEIQVSRAAVSAYGMEACISELEADFNRTLLPEFRLAAALASGAQGMFLILTGRGAGLRIVTPGAAGRLAA